MSFAAMLLVLTCAFFFAMLALLEIGRAVGLRQLRRDPEAARTGTGVVETALFALLGLLIAFTFNGAATRYDTRRNLIVQEANAAGTAWLRIDLLPEQDQAEIRKRFREYLDTRIRIHEEVGNPDEIQRDLARLSDLQSEIWVRARTGINRDGRTQTATLMVPALNEMFDIGSTRLATARMHVPTTILILLGGLMLLSALLAGFAMASRKSHHLLHSIVFAGILATTVFVTLDLEYPRQGFIRLNLSDRPLIDLRASWK